MLLYSCLSQWRWWRYHCCGNRRQSIQKTRNGTDTKIPITANAPEFLSPVDKMALEAFQRFQNNPGQLMLISLPTVVSLAICPLALYLHGPLVRFMWPPNMYPTPPNINVALGSFLQPAGLVYALAFGFAYQKAFGRQQMAVDNLRSYVTAVERVLFQAVSQRSVTKTQRLEIHGFLKDEVIARMKSIQRQSRKKVPSSRFTHRRGLVYRQLC